MDISMAMRKLTRRGKMVAVLVSSRDYERLTNGPPDLWDAIQKFRAEHDLSDLDVEEVFANVRDRSPGREVEW
jgi:cytochrome c556